jgi:CMP-2-keto-3-deoxyoctulosonic acid synthetase
MKPAINISSFLDLPLLDKVSALYEDGVFIIDIRYYKHKINLYLYDNAYVEVFINDKTSKIEKIERLPLDTTRLQFYADQLKVGVSRIKEKRGYFRTICP